MNPESFSIDANYPGGNIRINRISGNTAQIEQDLRDTNIWWFYWNFRVRGAQGRVVTFAFSDECMPESIRTTEGYKYNRRSPIGTRGPAFSRDQGLSWNWLGSDSVDGCSFHFPFSAGDSDVRFCFSIPYLESDLQRFLARQAGNPHIAVQTLCQTARGRTVERLQVGCLSGKPRHRAIFTARHHCCEMIASHALEGLLDAAISDPKLEWLRTNVELLAIPFVDKDGVEDGDQGKNRVPRDHNRDYDGHSLYASTRSIRDFIPKWQQGLLRLAIDLHCPTIRGEHNEKIYIVGSESPAIWRQQDRFGSILESVRQGPLPYLASDNLPFGQSWNTGRNFSAGKSFSAWAAELPGIELSGSFEIPYANVKGETVTAENARQFGRDLALATQQYLRSSSPPTNV